MASNNGAIFCHNGDQDNNLAPGAGAAYLFSRKNSSWTQSRYIKASNTFDGDLFGGSVALSSQLLAITARGEDSGNVGVNGNQTDDLLVVLA